jgi:translocon-associated protein subunit beta
LSRPAFKVKLQDDNFPADKFELVTGFSSANWAKIAPETNVSHVAVVRPKVIGAYNFTHATVSYLASEKATVTQVGYSSEIGQYGIQRLKDYNRKFASHTVRKINHKTIFRFD